MHPVPPPESAMHRALREDELVVVERTDTEVVKGIETGQRLTWLEICDESQNFKERLCRFVLESLLIPESAVPLTAMPSRDGGGFKWVGRYIPLI